MPKERLNILAEGIFFSLLNYCIEVYGNIWGLPTYDDQARQSPALRKEDLLKLQILMNKVLRSLTSLPKETPVSTLIAKSGQLSVHQRTALCTVTSVHKSILSKEPHYAFQKLGSTTDIQRNPRMNNNCTTINYNLSISRGSYFYRGSRIYNQLPQELVTKTTLQEFKRGAKEWIKNNILLLPP